MPAKRKISDYKQQERNHNLGSAYGSGLLENSLQANGFGRSILVSSDNVIIAGNHVQGKAGELGMENVIEVETDGNTLVVVKRKDVKSGTKAFHQLSLADNLISKHNFIEDADVTAAICEEYNISPDSIGATVNSADSAKDNPPEGLAFDEAAKKKGYALNLFDDPKPEDEGIVYLEGEKYRLAPGDWVYEAPDKEVFDESTLQGAKARFQARAAEANSLDYFIIFCFKTVADKRKWCKANKIDPKVNAVNGELYSVEDA